MDLHCEELLEKTYNSLSCLYMPAYHIRLQQAQYRSNVRTKNFRKQWL